VGCSSKCVEDFNKLVISLMHDMGEFKIMNANYELWKLETKNLKFEIKKIEV
jgi:hypothetical protein